MEHAKILLFNLILLIIYFTHIQCGTIDWNQEDERMETSEPRIIGGEKARLGEFKGIVSIQTKYEEHVCGGTLISPTVILTAAHCVVNKAGVVKPEAVHIMGDGLRISSYPDPMRQKRIAKKIVVHRKFSGERKPPKYDIALITVDSPFSSTATFSPVNVTDFEAIDNEKCRIAGWGKLGPNDPNFSKDLMAVSISVIPTASCNGTTSYNGRISQGTFCAGVLSGGRDACQGDSGGGLICNGTVKGVVSWGQGCAEKNFPGVYTDVFQYREWIERGSANSLASSTFALIIIIFMNATNLRRILLEC